MSESAVELVAEFEKINLQGSSKASGKVHNPIVRPDTSLKLKARSKGKSLIRPARLKLLGSCFARNIRNNIQEDETTSDEKPATVKAEDLETFASEAFLQMRITPQEALSPAPEEKSSQSSQPNSCSAQAKLQPQFPSSSELDSEFDVEILSEFLGFHLNLQDKNYLVNSMYT